MIVTIGSTTLATHSDRTVGLPSSPAELVHSGEVQIQESNPIRANRRKLYPRGNRGGILSFGVSIKYANLNAAGMAAMSLPYSQPGLSGNLSITPSSGSTVTIPGAVVKSCEVSQRGVTIDITYTIEY